MEVVIPHIGHYVKLASKFGTLLEGLGKSNHFGFIVQPSDFHRDERGLAFNAVSSLYT